MQVADEGCNRRGVRNQALFGEDAPFDVELDSTHAEARGINLHGAGGNDDQVFHRPAEIQSLVEGLETEAEAFQGCEVETVAAGVSAGG